MNSQPMTIPVCDALLENVDLSSPWEGQRWHMSAAEAEEPAKILLKDEDEKDETTTGTTTPGSGRSSSRSNPPSPGTRGRRRESFKEISNKSSLTGASINAEQANQCATGLMVTMTNISHMYTEHMVIEELRDGGFQQLRDIDFFYMPMDCVSGVHHGCCFINFVDKAVRNEFLSAFEGRCLRLAGPASPRLQVQNTAPEDLEQFLTYGFSPGQVQEEPQRCPLKTPRRAQFCPFCGNHVGSSFNFCSQCGSSLMQLR